MAQQNKLLNLNLKGLRFFCVVEYFFDTGIMNLGNEKYKRIVKIEYENGFI